MVKSIIIFLTYIHAYTCILVVVETVSIYCSIFQSDVSRGVVGE